MARISAHDVSAATGTAAAYQPAFVDCSSLFANQRCPQSTVHEDDVTQSQNNSLMPQDFQKDMWAMTEYQSLGSHRRQHQLHYSSQYDRVIVW